MTWGVIWDSGPVAPGGKEAEQPEVMHELAGEVMRLAPGLADWACFHRTTGATWEERADMARQLGEPYGERRLFLTFRWNAEWSPEPRGLAVYYRPGCEVSLRLAYGFVLLLRRSLFPELPPYWIGHWADACPLLLAAGGPAVRICPGFLTNPTDRQLLASDGFRRRLAEAVVVALARNFGWRFIFLPGQAGFLDLDLTLPSGATAAELAAALRGTLLEGREDTFLAAEAEQGVSSLFLCGQALHNLACYPDLLRCKHNVLAYGADRADPFERAATFASPEEAIQSVAAVLRRDFLNPESGLYHGPTVKGVGLHYSDDPLWPYQVAARMEQIRTAHRTGQRPDLLALGRRLLAGRWSDW